MRMLPAVRLSQYAVETTARQAERIRPLVRITSTALTTACRQAGLPLDIAELCGGLLASVVDDLVAASTLPRSDFERAKRMERVLAATEEPAIFAPAFGYGCVTDERTGLRAALGIAICDKGESGKFAWLLGLQNRQFVQVRKKD